jgi:hypothetical protein
MNRLTLLFLFLLAFCAQPTLGQQKNVTVHREHLHETL